MRVLVLASVLLAVTIPACDSDSTRIIDPVPDPAIGTYDMQATPTRSVNCGGTLGVIVNGDLSLSADHTWVKGDIFTTPSGNLVCGWTGGTWVRDNSTSLTLTISTTVSGANPIPVTVVGDDLTLGVLNTPYKRRRP